MLTPSPQALVQVALGQKGYTEKGGRDGKSGNITKFGADYGMNAVSWCSIYVWWCFMQLGIDLRKALTPAYASAEAALEAWQSHGLRVYKNPLLGDVGFCHFPEEHAGANHTFIEIGSSTGGQHTVEGNTSMPGATGSQVNGGGVYERFRPNGVIIGYGRYPWPAPAPKPPVRVPIANRKFPTLHFGMGSPTPNEDVKRLQALLHVPVTGYFDAVTQKHVKQAEFNRQLLQDGIAGPALLSKLGF